GERACRLTVAEQGAAGRVRASFDFARDRLRPYVRVWRLLRSRDQEDWILSWQHGASPALSSVSPSGRVVHGECSGAEGRNNKIAIVPNVGHSGNKNAHFNVQDCACRSVIETR